jgi:cytochrome oxidase assembly protein ShyY1
VVVSSDSALLQLEGQILRMAARRETQARTRREQKISRTRSGIASGERARVLLRAGKRENAAARIKVSVRRQRLAADGCASEFIAAMWAAREDRHSRAHLPRLLSWYADPPNNHISPLIERFGLQGAVHA